MKKYINILFLIICLSAIVAGCKKGNIKPTGIVGSWELRAESGTIAGYIKTFPAGNGHIVQFNADNTYKISLKDTLINQGTYQVIKNNISLGGITYDGIYYDGSPSGDFIVIKADSLTIGNTFPDGVTSGYVRK